MADDSCCVDDTVWVHLSVGLADVSDCIDGYRYTLVLVWLMLVIC